MLLVAAVVTVVSRMMLERGREAADIARRNLRMGAMVMTPRHDMRDTCLPSPVAEW
jgi:hypothetical protein